MDTANSFQQSQDMADYPAKSGHGSAHWCQLKPKARQGLKSLSNSESPRSRTAGVLQSSIEDFRFETGVSTPVGLSVLP